MWYKERLHERGVDGLPPSLFLENIDFSKGRFEMQTTRPFIAAKFVDRYVLAHRFSSFGISLSEARFVELAEGVASARNPPAWLLKMLPHQHCGNVSGCLGEMILIRNPVEGLRYGKASYEVDSRCNYRCPHCYLSGSKSKSSLTLDEKKRIINLIEASGCVWLQMTGGEVLLEKNFEELYTHAFSLGLLPTISTNGSPLADKESVRRVLVRLPPYRVTVSMYGASKKSYESFTGSPGSFERFRFALEWLKSSAVRTRINIILHTGNIDELREMEALCRTFGFEYFVFRRMMPTLSGDIRPIMYSTECDSQESPRRNVVGSCSAGRTFFHIDSSGLVSICKTARSERIDFLGEGLDGLRKLPAIAKTALTPSYGCQTCVNFGKTCSTCRPILDLYHDIKEKPLAICSNGKGVRHEK